MSMTPEMKRWRDRFLEIPEGLLVLRCADCRKPIIAEDDDAGVCIQCGGRNRRKDTNQ